MTHTTTIPVAGKRWGPGAVHSWEDLGQDWPSFLGLLIGLGIVGTVCLQHSLCKTSQYPQHRGLKCEKAFLAEVTQKN